MAKKVYAVRTGRKPGIYETWDECKSMVHGYKGAEYKSFSDRKEAERFLHKESEEVREEAPDTVIAYVDGSYSGERRRYAYGCVLLYQGESGELSGSGNDACHLGMRNVAGEILGAMKAIEWALQKQAAAIVIHYDYAGIEMWANGLWQTNREGTREYKDYVRRARERIDIRFVKVKAHTGVELNERADGLAKGALEKEEGAT